MSTEKAKGAKERAKPPARCGFSLKNDVMLLKNDDIAMKNDAFLSNNVDFRLKNVEIMLKLPGGCRAFTAAGRTKRKRHWYANYNFALIKMMHFAFKMMDFMLKLCVAGGLGVQMYGDRLHL